ncbi:uncharacterized protein B0H64DRAFT_190254 [Chaetomium fimeti]|uniref:Uncharacterized protein n=1 Tax=Chaetomium fimeti TaxID=1854472 RepID=A0AAE0HDK2_9PEZI|nr:hypothetical protein B0H64DRAFT_190254 [Chaetomium fimeti]
MRYLLIVNFTYSILLLLLTGGEIGGGGLGRGVGGGILAAGGLGPLGGGLGDGGLGGGGLGGGALGPVGFLLLSLPSAASTLLLLMIFINNDIPIVVNHLPSWPRRRRPAPLAS